VGVAARLHLLLAGCPSSPPACGGLQLHRIAITSDLLQAQSRGRRPFGRLIVAAVTSPPVAATARRFPLFCWLVIFLLCFLLTVISALSSSDTLNMNW